MVTGLDENQCLAGCDEREQCFAAKWISLNGGECLYKSKYKESEITDYQHVTLYEKIPVQQCGGNINGDFIFKYIRKVCTDSNFLINSKFNGKPVKCAKECVNTFLCAEFEYSRGIC